MGFISGKNVRLYIDTSSNNTPVWKVAHHETTVGMSLGSETVDITTKDTADFQAAIKTGINVTLSCTAKMSDNPGANDLTYSDVLAMALETNADANNGIRKFKMAGSKAGEPVVEFTGFVESIDNTNAAEDVGEYTFSIRVVSKPLISAVPS
jgi:hypothetical protein